MKKKLIVFTLIVTFLFNVSACSIEPEEICHVNNDSAFIGSYFTGEYIDNIIMAKSESVYSGYMIFGTAYSFGPSDAQYRGIVKISEEDGGEIFENYTWSEVSDITLGTNMVTGELDISEYTNNGRKWYSSVDFVKSRFDAIMVEYVYFDGVDTFYFNLQSY